MVESHQVHQNLKTIFDTALSSPKKVILWHCSGGKYRTGFASAVFLAALQVPKEAIIYDYKLNKSYRSDFDQHEREAMQTRLANNKNALSGFAAIQGARPEFIEAALNKIEKEYGSIDAYLERHIGLQKNRYANCAPYIPNSPTPNTKTYPSRQPIKPRALNPL